MIYVEREHVLYRATSGTIAAAVRSVEETLPREVDLRYMPNIYNNDIESNNRFNLLDQLIDHQYIFSPFDYSKDLAAHNIREGLAFDATQPINNKNHPFIIFNPKCTHTIRAVKHYLNPNNYSLKNDPIYETAHQSIGLLVLTEPSWLKEVKYG